MPNEEPEEFLRPPTPPLDAKVATLAARFTDHIAASGEHSDDEDILDELERELEDGFDLGAARERRMEELRREIDKVRDMRENDHGKYTEISDEKEVIRVSANEARCVVHFYHRNFQRCKIMDKHLEEIAPRYFSTRFIRVFVENVPWLVEKLAIKVLPCVICFVGGVSTDRVIGFEELGNIDGFETATLEIRLQMAGVLEKPKALDTSSGIGKTTIRGREDDNDDPFDLDD